MECLEYMTVYCPYCGEINELTIERSEYDQTYSEDCQVCCCPMQIWVSGEGEDMDVAVSR